MKDEIFRFEISARSKRNVRIYILAECHTGPWKVSVYQANPVGGRRLNKTLTLPDQGMSDVLDMIKKELPNFLTQLNEQRHDVKPKVSL